jgi:hypothetical protein
MLRLLRIIIDQIIMDLILVLKCLVEEDIIKDLIMEDMGVVTVFPMEAVMVVDTVEGMGLEVIIENQQTNESLRL